MPPKETIHRAGGSRRPLHRIHVIHEAVKEGCFPNCRNLAERLEVTDKTVQRDISFMRDELGLPLEYDSRMHGYTYTQAVEECPTFELGAKELAGFLHARSALGAVRGTAIEHTLRDVFSPLNRMVERQIKISSEELEKVVSRRENGVAKVDPEIFGRLAEAVLRQRATSFHYHKIGASRSELRSIRPYHLGEVEGCWYVVGHDLDRDALRSFALPRVSRVSLLADTFVRPREFDGGAYMERSFGVWADPKEAPLRTVRIELSGYAARMAQERTWHPTQELMRSDDDSRVEVRFRVSRPEELLRWVLGWGGKAKVLEPECLIRRVRLELDRMLEANR